MKRSGSHHILQRPSIEPGLFELCSGRGQLDSPPSHLPPTPTKKVSIKQLKKSMTLKPRGTHSSMLLRSESVANQPRTPQSSRKVQFTYSEMESMKNSSVNNYHTTNYIMDQCIFHPQQLKVIIEQPSPPPTPLAKTHQPRSQQGEARRDSPEAALTRPPLMKKASFQESPAFRSDPQSPLLEQRSKQNMVFYSQDLGSVKSDPDRAEPEAGNTSILVEDGEEQGERPKKGNEFDERMTFGREKRFGVTSADWGNPKLALQPRTLKKKSFQKGQLFCSGRKTSTLNVDVEDSDHESEVIEDFNSLMYKIQENRLEDIEDDESHSHFRQI